MLSSNMMPTDLRHSSTNPVASGNSGIDITWKKKIFQWEYGQSAIARWVTWHVTSMESTVRHVDLTLPHFRREEAARTLDRERKRMIPCDLECRCASARDRRVRQEQADMAIPRRRFKRAFFPSPFGFFFSLGKTRKRAQKSFKNLAKFLLNYMLSGVPIILANVWNESFLIQLLK